MKLISPNTPIMVTTPDGKIIEIDAIDYAIGKAGCLGINEAGKTYAAGYMAEQLMKRGIPITVISPSPGRPWRYLKIPKPGKEGFPVVIVGEDGDLPLDPDRVGEIASANGSDSAVIVDRSKYEIWFPRLVGKQKDMLNILIDRRKVTLHQLRVLIGMSDSGTFGDYHRGLVKLGLARLESSTLYLVDID
jgi:hypothetical protein